jgi:hypothetical protein
MLPTGLTLIQNFYSMYFKISFELLNITEPICAGDKIYLIEFLEFSK